MLTYKELQTSDGEMKNIEISYENKPCYDIVLSNDFNKLHDSLSKLDIDNRKICIITDSNIAPFHLEGVGEILKRISSKVFHFIIEPGEINKTLDTINNMYEFLIDAKFDRNDILIALGGGVVGDMTGFCAATYLRGIKFIQIPTTLLSQVDSSMGGKTGVDYKAFKNMIGAFHMPSLVYINVSTLSTLNKRDYLSGMGEVIKYGIIEDKDYFNFLVSNVEKIISKDPETLLVTIANACLVKKGIVERDPKEKNERVLLNFGHTAGHAIEKLSNFTILHGECVCLGMIIAANISKNKGLISDSEVDSIIKAISLFELPVKGGSPHSSK